MTFDQNTLRRLNKLWKDRHTHDGETTVDRVTIIEEQIGELADKTAGADVGAFVHLERAATQSIAAGGEKISWDMLYGGISPFVFDVEVPLTDVEIPVAGYYDVTVMLGWSSFASAGTVTILRIRDGLETEIWPPASDPGVWDASAGSVFVDEAPAVPFLKGDLVAVKVDHGDASAQTLASAVLAVDLVDRFTASAGAEGVVAEALSWRMDLTSQDLDVEMTTAQQAGDQIIAVFAAGSNQFDTGTYPAGWTTLVSNQLFGNSAGYWTALEKESDGTETDFTISVLTGNDEMAAAIFVVRSGRDYSAVGPTINTPNKNASTTIDPNSVTPAAGAGAYLVATIVARNGGAKTPTSGPTDYTLSSVLQMPTQGGSDTHPGIEIWYRSLNITTSEDPDTITYPTWTAQRLGAGVIAIPI